MTLPSSGPLSLSDIQGEFGGSNPIGMNEYYAGGGLVPSGTTGTYGAVPTSGQISVQNFYGTSNYVPVYIEDLFSTWIYTGNGATQTITNGINLSGSGGLVWIKGRNGSAAPDHLLYDTSRGATNGLVTNSSGATYTNANTLTAFTSSGFSVGSYVYVNGPPSNPPFGDSFVSWTFRKQPKFFDVVTYTGNGTNGRTVAHSLGSTPGCIIVKRTDASNGWAVYHRAMNASPQDYMMRLNATDGAFTTTPSRWNNTLPTSTEFTLSGNDEVNGSGATYVAYLFAHNAGGFGLTGTDNVISCGSYSGTGATGNAITLGYEPQFVIVKRTDTTADWITMDAMRGGYLKPNTSDTELGASGWFNVAGDNFFPTATGFQVNTAGAAWNASGGTYIYIAIRRGPMKVPTVGTTVFSPNAVNVPQGTQITTGFPVDTTFPVYRSNQGPRVEDRLRGISTSTTNSTTEYYLSTPSTAAESNSLGFTYGWNNTGFLMNAGYANAPDVFWSFQRAPSFFDEICYTGTGSFSQTVTHNLGVVPEMAIVKSRNVSDPWRVTISAGGSVYQGYLNSTDTFFILGSNPSTASYFAAGDLSSSDYGVTYVGYLFASCTGVSKIGKYTGTAALQTINCGFTTGARFVLIRRADSTGDWYVWDSARGISSGTDPYLLMNSTAAEVTGTNYVDTTSVGFQVTAAAPSGINASGGTYIFLAIA